VNPTPEKALRVRAVLEVLGAPLARLSAGDLSAPGIVFQIGVQPDRIDVRTAPRPSRRPGPPPG
jgi:hypothetical protein